MNESVTQAPMPTPAHCPRCGTPLPTGALGGLCPACLLKQGAAADTATDAGSAAFLPPDLAEVARLFPQLEILGLLGKGGMGAVYKARQPALDRLVALKILPAQTGAGGNSTERFNREARALARLSHPNIVAVHEFGATGGLNYFLMEFVDGVNLRQLQRAGRLSPREALQIVPQVCDALQYAHDEGIVHRDIKPENILIDRKGRVKIADFGLARILGSDPADLRLTGEGHVMGTPHYMAPEQVEHPQAVDHRADIYSLGVVFYEMLTGELPLGRFSPPSRKVQVDVRLDDIVLHALEKEPERRYQHVAEVKTAVHNLTQSAPPPPIGPGPQAERAGDSTRAGAGDGRGTQAPSAKAAVIGVLVAFVTFAAAFVITGLAPRYYGARAVVAVNPIAELKPGMSEFDPYVVATEMEWMKSTAMLGQVIERLNLQDRWGQRLNLQDRWGQGQRMPADLALINLSKRLTLRQTRNTPCIEIWFRSEHPGEAAEIANAIAETCRNTRPSGTIEIVDSAQPSPREVRPNVPLNLAVGAVLGLFLGLLAAGLTLRLNAKGSGALTASAPSSARTIRSVGAWTVVAIVVAGFVLLAIFSGSWLLWTRPARIQYQPGPVASGADTNGTSRQATVLLLKMRQEYAGAATVVATGTTMTTRISPGAPFEKLNQFEIRLSRPNRYRIEWRSAAGQFETGCGAVWSSDQPNWFWMQPQKAEQLASRSLALGAAVGVSQNVTSWLPELFFGNAPWIEVLGDLRSEPDEAISGEPCYVISGVFQNRRTRLWIVQSDRRLRQVENTDEAEGPSAAALSGSAIETRQRFRTVQTYERMELDSPLSDEDFSFTPPAKP